MELCDVCQKNQDAEFNTRQARAFWGKVRKGAEQACWSARNTQGRVAVVSFMENGKVRRRQAHRFAYEMTFGPVRDDQYVMHTCGNEVCLNPKHLFLEKRSSVRSRVAKELFNRRPGQVAPVTVQAVANGTNWSHPPRPAKLDPKSLSK